jgi:cell division inhibitor SepF
MSVILNRVKEFVGWETDEEENESESQTEFKEEFQQPHVLQYGLKKQLQERKVVSMPSASQMKVIITQPQGMEDAQEVCDHLKDKRPVIVNLESLEQKECAQRIIDFLCGAVYSLDGSIQKISNGIFIIAPFNVDISGSVFKDEIKSKLVFPWIK